LSRIDESNAAKLLSTAKWYDRVGDPIAAELTIRRLIATYPRSVATADALRFIPQVLTRLPLRTIEQAPDYSMLRETILGVTEELTKTVAVEGHNP
jgi:outer membrane protein assembly factor BamD (BamD/ComL family)